MMLVEGLNQIIIEAQKNGSISKAVVNITLDTVSPELFIMQNQTYINSSSLNLSYTSNASDILSYRVRLNNSAWVATNNSYYLFENLTEGEAFIEVQALDHAGNIGEARVNLTVDLTPPFIEIIKPDANEVIKTRYIEMAGKTQEGANISINGMSLRTDNGTWNIAIVLSGVNNPFRIESIDKAGNKAEKTINIRIGENLSYVKPSFEEFLNLSINFSTPGKFEGNNDAVAGKYVSYLFYRNESVFIGYSIYDSESTTLWFNKISIKGFTDENSSISGPIATYKQGEKFGEQHSVYVEIHDNKMGTMLLDIRPLEDIYGKVREYLMNKPRERLRINVSREKNVTIERKEAGNLTPFYINENWTSWPEITFEPANGVNVTEISNGYRFQKDKKAAYLFRANYAGGSSEFAFEENKLVAKVNNSLLIFRQFPGMNLTDEELLDTLIAEGISDGVIGAEFFIDDIGSYDVVTFGDLTISAGFPDTDTMELNASSASLNGTVLAVGMSGKYYNNLLNKNLTIRYDGTELYPASGYQDIMDVTNDFGHAEYLLVMGSNGTMVLVSIPGFSSHTISFKVETPAGGFGSMIVDLLNFLSAGLFLALPAASREVAFSIWWFAIVLIIYIVIRKAVRRRN
ncbi:MAG: hypothetical protein WAW23_13475 [Candidatus Methanoperedens sp.]